MTLSPGRFAGKTVVVTGAARGIGKAVALRMAAEGAQVVIADLAAEHAEVVAGQVREGGGRALVVSGDLSTSEGPWCGYAALPHMVERKAGAIVNVGSTAAGGIYHVALTTARSHEVAGHVCASTASRRVRPRPRTGSRPGTYCGPARPVRTGDRSPRSPSTGPSPWGGGGPWTSRRQPSPSSPRTRRRSAPARSSSWAVASPSPDAGASSRATRRTDDERPCRPRQVRGLRELPRGRARGRRGVSAGNALAGAYFADGHAVAAVTLSAPHLLARLRPLVAEGADRAAVLRAAQPLDLVPVQPAGAGR